MGDGNRTHNVRSHSPVLCQLSYAHRFGKGTTGWKLIIAGGKTSSRMPSLGFSASEFVIVEVYLSTVRGSGWVCNMEALTYPFATRERY